MKNRKSGKRGILVVFRPTVTGSSVENGEPGAALEMDGEGGAGERKFGGFGVWEFAGEDEGEGKIGRSGNCLVSFGFRFFVGVDEERKKRERVRLLGELKRKRGEGRGSGDRHEGEGGKGSGS
ncbi:hypothetical protein HAX54_007617 [Datura stramonium]|uniref:Uncharacterized protein n=1 Tax=Datura stramonium TaxID=4076 RepID=A0ABS8WUR4_DATST|nr:hypothetical protein [Datura stramonium]